MIVKSMKLLISDLFMPVCSFFAVNYTRYINNIYVAFLYFRCLLASPLLSERGRYSDARCHAVYVSALLCCNLLHV